MAWQEALALGIVAATVALFLRRLLRPRRFDSRRGGHCGCAGASLKTPPPSIILHARKGGPTRVIIKSG